MSPRTRCPPRTCGPRTSCPPGRVVLGPNVPCQDRMSPLPGPTVKYQRHLSSDVKLGAGPENKAGSIQQSFLENCYAQDGMQPLVLQATHFAECGLLGSLAGQTLE